MGLRRLLGLKRLRPRKTHRKGATKPYSNRTDGFLQSVEDNIRRDFAANDIAVPSTSLGYASDIPTSHAIRLYQDGVRTRVEFSDTVQSEYWNAAVARRAATHLAWFTAADVDGPVLCDPHDGNRPTMARYRFSVAEGDPNAVAVPDAYFFHNRGHALMRTEGERAALAWADRSDRVVWRGRANGNGLLSFDAVHRDNPLTMQRIRMAWICRDLGVDFRFTPEPGTEQEAALMRAGLLGERMLPETWGTMKLAIDIDGYTCTWDNLLHRMLLGCCVLKVESEFAWRQWYYDRMEPWRHFVPVRADLSDLSERLDWARTYDDEARAIAEEGQRFAQSLDVETERLEAGRIIARAEGKV